MGSDEHIFPLQLSLASLVGLIFIGNPLQSRHWTELSSIYPPIFSEMCNQTNYMNLVLISILIF